MVSTECIIQHTEKKWFLIYECIWLFDCVPVHTFIIYMHRQHNSSERVCIWIRTTCRWNIQYLTLYYFSQGKHKKGHLRLVHFPYFEFKGCWILLDGYRIFSTYISRWKVNSFFKESLLANILCALFCQQGQKFWKTHHLLWGVGGGGN